MWMIIFFNFFFILRVVAKQSALGLKIFTGFINPLNCGMVRILAVSYVNLF